MRKSKYTNNQILAILKKNENGMSTATFYNWRAKFGEIDVSLMQRLNILEEENIRLKTRYAEERLKAEIRQEALEIKW